MCILPGSDRVFPRSHRAALSCRRGPCPVVDRPSRRRVSGFIRTAYVLTSRAGHTDPAFQAAVRVASDCFTMHISGGEQRPRSRFLFPRPKRDRPAQSGPRRAPFGRGENRAVGAICVIGLPSSGDFGGSNSVLLAWALVGCEPDGPRGDRWPGGTEHRPALTLFYSHQGRHSASGAHDIQSG